MRTVYERLDAADVHTTLLRTKISKISDTLYIAEECAANIVLAEHVFGPLQ